MDWKIFASTFVLIFFAELGDKTQLSVVAAASEARSPWTVFLGATAALSAAVAIAVVFSTLFRNFLPTYYLQWISAAIFFGFGFWTLYKIFRPTSSDLAQHASQAWAQGEYEELGLVSRWTISAALEFEDHARRDYEAAAELTENPQLRELFQFLAHEDHNHGKFVEKIARSGFQGLEMEKSGSRATGSHIAVERPGLHDSLPRASDAFDRDMQLLHNAAQHEVTSHRFYQAMAQSVVGHRRLSAFFQRLASEEITHLQKIEELRASLLSKKLALS